MKLCRYMLPCGYCEKYSVPCQAEPDSQDKILSINQECEHDWVYLISNKSGDHYICSKCKEIKVYPTKVKM